jgi:cell division septum initiation protein DivIVA
MPTDEQRLLVRLEASTRQMEAAMARATKLTKDRADQIAQNFGRANARVTQGLAQQADNIVRFDRAARSGGQGMQNLGFQVQDFAVQVAGGTDASRALAQQLPQLLSGFGGLGLAIGTAAAVLIPLGSALLGAAEDSQSAADAADGMNASLKALQDTGIPGSIDGLIELQQKYGEINAEILLLIARQRELAVENAKGKAAAIIPAVQAEFGDYIEAAREAQEFGRVTAEMNANFRAETGLSVEQVLRFGDALRELAAAAGPEEQTRLIAEMNDLLDQSTIATNDLKSAMLEAQSAMAQVKVQVEGVFESLGRAINQAGGLSGALQEAARWFGEVTRAQRETAAAQRDLQSGRANKITALIYGQYQDSRLQAPAAPAAPAPARSGGGGGGRGAGGGMSEVQRAQNDLLREGERLFQATRTEAERYATEQKNIERLFEAGVIDADTYNRAITDLGARMGELTEVGKEIEGAFQNAFADLVTGAASVKSVIADLLDQLARMAANSAFQSLVGGLGGGGGLGGFLGSLFGGFRANGGPVAAGRAYVVGERGPELFMPRTSGMIAPNGGGQRGPVAININLAGANGDMEVARIAREAVQAGLRIYDRQVAPQRVAQATRDPRGRG